MVKLSQINVKKLTGSVSDIIEKFTAWQVNSTLNFTRKTDIGFSSEIYRGIRSSGSEFFLNRIAKATW